VLHVAVEEGAAALRVLRDAIDARLSPLCRWEPETRPFAPHLTLARGRAAARFRPDAFARLRAEADWPAVAFDAADVTIFSSKTLPSGPVYTAEARAALRS
jgi:2'-5' RNA ligase